VWGIVSVVSENQPRDETWIELVELLQVLRDWLAQAGPAVEASLTEFLASDDHPLARILADLDRFELLLSRHTPEQK
jgi:hypothetical protein